MKTNIKDRGIGAILALLIPGTGYMYAGRIGWGIFLFILIPIGYMLGFFPGLLFHILSIVGTTGAINEYNKKIK